MGKKYDYHAKGQKDASQRRYKPPHGVLEEFFSIGDRNRSINRNNRDYDSGYKKGSVDRKYNKKKY